MLKHVNLWHILFWIHQQTILTWCARKHKVPVDCKCLKTEVAMTYFAFTESAIINMSYAKTPSTPVSALNPEQACFFSASWMVFVFYLFFCCQFLCIFSLFVCLSWFFCMFLFLCWVCWLSVSQNYIFGCLNVNCNCGADGQDGEKAGGDARWSPHGHCPHPCSQAWAQVGFQVVSHFNWFFWISSQKYLDFFLKYFLFLCQFCRSVSQPCSPAAPLGERLSAAEARRAAIDGLKVGFSESVSPPLLAIWIL